jgi:hypothetical protein
MRAKVPVIRTASDTPGPSRFNVGINLRKAERDILKKMMAKRGNHSWEPPTAEIVIETSDEIVRLMQSNSDIKGGR